LLFEGSEKKAEIFIDRNIGSLLTDIAPQYWHRLVAKAGAKIISSIENTQCRAYLLSESSLFVWHDRLLILTCGTTHLANAIEFFLLSQPKITITGINYQRKNEYFAQHQPSCFKRDIDVLQRHLAGRNYVVGNVDGHHSQLFQHRPHPQQDLSIPPAFELLAYQICAQARLFFTSSGLTTRDVCQFLGLSQLLAQFTIDEHFFSPCGYSLNALRDNDYLTIHITPQASSSYVSIISNLDLIGIIEPVLAKLSPGSFDVLVANQQVLLGISPTISVGYRRYNKETQQISDRCWLHYVNFESTIITD